MSQNLVKRQVERSCHMESNECKQISSKYGSIIMNDMLFEIVSIKMLNNIKKKIIKNELVFNETINYWLNIIFDDFFDKY